MGGGMKSPVAVGVAPDRHEGPEAVGLREVVSCGRCICLCVNYDNHHH